MKIVITGSFGNISKPLTQALVQKGHLVTVVSSNAERQKDIEALGAKPAIGSLENPEFLATVFAGADAVYCMVPPNNYFDHNLDLTLVTGGSRGLGEIMSIALAKKGIDVILTYKNNQESANEVVSAIQSLRQKATAFQLDTSYVKSFDNFIGQIAEYLQEQTGSLKLKQSAQSINRSKYTATYSQQIN